MCRFVNLPSSLLNCPGGDFVSVCFAFLTIQTRLSPVFLMSVCILGQTKRLLINLVVARRPGCESLWKCVNNLFLSDGSI